MQKTSPNIPKIIHYCWFGNSEFPPLIKKCMTTWEKHLTDWKIMRWDESNIPVNVAYLNYALEKKIICVCSRLYALPCTSPIRRNIS